MVVGALAAYGAWKVFKTGVSALYSINRHLMRCNQNLYQKYGKEGSYAVVTGGSDGIGLELCH